MDLLKQKNWWIWLLISIFGGWTSNLFLGALLNVYDKEAWYAKWQNWLLGILLLVFPFVIMVAIFNLQITSLVAAKLDVPGKEIYLSPYIWILLLIIPIIGWILLSVLIIYLNIWIIVMLYRGSGEQYVLSN